MHPRVTAAPAARTGAAAEDFARAANPARETPAPPDPAPAAEGPKPADGDALTLEKLQDLWDGFVTFVRQKKVSLGVCLMGAKLHAFDGKHLALRFMRSFSLQRDQVALPKNIQFVRNMFHKYFGCEIELTIFNEGEEKAFALEEKARKQPTPEQRFKVSDEHKPVLKKIISEFDGEVVRYKR